MAWVNAAIALSCSPRCENIRPHDWQRWTSLAVQLGILRGSFTIFLVVRSLPRCDLGPLEGDEPGRTWNQSQPQSGTRSTRPRSGPHRCSRWPNGYRPGSSGQGCGHPGRVRGKGQHFLPAIKVPNLDRIRLRCRCQAIPTGMPRQRVNGRVVTVKTKRQPPVDDVPNFDHVSRRGHPLTVRAPGRYAANTADVG